MKPKTNKLIAIITILIFLILAINQINAMSYNNIYKIYKNTAEFVSPSTHLPSCDLSIKNLYISRCEPISIPLDSIKLVKKQTDQFDARTICLIIMANNTDCGDLQNVPISIDKGDGTQPIRIYINMPNNQIKASIVPLSYENGIYTINVTIDPDNIIQEINETNNEKLKTHQIGYSTINVQITNLNPTYRANDTVNVRARVTHTFGTKGIKEVIIKIKNPRNRFVVQTNMQPIEQIPNGYVYEYNYTLPTGNPSNKGTWNITIDARQLFGSPNITSTTFQLINSPPSWRTVPHLWALSESYPCRYNFTPYVYDLDGDLISDVLGCNQTPLDPITCEPVTWFIVYFYPPHAGWQGERQTELLAQEVPGGSSWSNRFNIQFSTSRPQGYVDCTYRFDKNTKYISTRPKNYETKNK